MTNKAFGKALRADYFFEEGYVPLNHGSFGACPKALMPLRESYQRKAEANPDRWLRKDMFPILKANRDRLAAFVHCDPEELTFVVNASTGVNAVLRSVPLEPGDKILTFNTAYDAVERTLAFVQDTRHAKLVLIDLAYPLSDQEILDMTKATIERELAAGGGKIRLAVFDAISSVPGVLFPYEAMVKLCKQYGILSLVDGAHAVGHIPLDLHAVDPDFFTSNCHKWLSAPRGAAFLYVPKRNQHFVHPTIINKSYQNHTNPNGTISTFQEEFAWPGTSDFSNYMVIQDALAYRESLGGEQAIQTYCHSLAVQGGQLVADILGTDVLENKEKTLTVSMVNVRLPLRHPRIPDDKVVSYLQEILMEKHHTFASIFKHNGHFYTRLSAQVYLDLDDFKHTAHAILNECQALETA